MAGESAAPAIREVYREAVRAGAHVTVRTNIEGLTEIFFQEANDDQLQYVSEVSVFEMEHFNKYLGFQAEQNSKALSAIDPKRLATSGKARQPLQSRMMTRAAAGDLHWCATLYPTNGYAQDAGMSLSDYEEFVYCAELIDQADPIAGWKAVHDTQQHIVDYLTKHDEIHIVTPDNTDITYRVGGRTWMNADGKVNFPDGEVFTGPIEDSVNGTVAFSYPAIYAGNEVEDVRLTFENGRVVDFSARRGQDFLRAMLDMDEGSRTLGEVAFGLNYNIPRFSRRMLFDEKLGGTMHMALGAAYPDTGGLNHSGLHWDMLCDLHSGKVYADGELCYQDGKFII